MSENFLINNKLHIQETQWTSSRINTKTLINWHIIEKCWKTNTKKILKAVGKKITHYLQGKPSKINNSWIRSMNIGSQKAMRKQIISAQRKHCQSRILNWAKLSSKNEDKIKIKAFQDKQKLRQFFLVELPYRKYWRNFLRLKASNPRC